jgi:hypothetical protein
MFATLLGLIILGGLELVAGFVWLLISAGQTHRRSGPEVGAEVFGQVLRADDEDGGASVSLAERSTFRGTGVQVEREAEVSYAAIKAALRERRWRDAMPGLLALAGMTELCVFGSLALFVSWEDKFIGGLIVAVVLYTLTRIWIGFVRA